MNRNTAFLHYSCLWSTKIGTYE